MLNKNDPLIGAVQEVMKRNHAEREAAKLVNEKFGVTDRKALPHEKQGAWDAAYKQVLTEGLHPNQQKLDVHEPEKDKLTKHDFKMLRAKKKPMEEDVTSPSSMGIKKPDYATGTPDYAKPKEQTVNRAAKTSLPARTMKEEEQIDEKAPPGAKYERMVKHIKDKMAKGGLTKKEKSIAYATAWKAKKKSDVNEGFNNRHGLSVAASAEKQAVTDQLNEAGGPVPSVVKKQQAMAASKRMSSRIKAREPRELTSFERFQAREKAKPTPVIGGAPVAPGPVGALKSVVGAGIRAGANYFSRRQQSVPQVQGQGGPSGRMPPSGAWGNIRNARTNDSARISAGRDPSRSMATRDTFQGKLAQLRQTTPNAAASNAARAARINARQSTPNAAASNAARTTLAKRVQNMRSTGGSEGARRVPQTAFTNDTQSVATQPNTAKAAAPTVAMAARKIEATPRKVSDTEIMNAPQYKQAVKASGGPEGARKIQAGTDVAGVGKVEKGQTIWSKVKSQLEKQPVKGFEAGANKGGAGR